MNRPESNNKPRVLISGFKMRNFGNHERAITAINTSLQTSSHCAFDDEQRCKEALQILKILNQTHLGSYSQLPEAK